MKTANIPFQNIDWSNVPKTEHKGETGISYWRTVQFEGLRVRMVEYSPNYIADHWCQKGHIIYCLEGNLTTEFEDGTSAPLKKGESYIVSDELSSHRSVTTDDGATLFIIDGDFLKLNK
jgi:mannose-6-phosphate isomerase class I